MDSISENRRVGFGAFVLDLESRVLTRDGVVVRLPAKVVDTLVVLVQARGEVVSKEALLAQVWPTTIVEESGLQRNISLLRKEFQNQSAEDLIETVPKRGYRFTGQLHEPRAPVRPASPAVPEEITPATNAVRRGSRAWLAWAGGLSIVAVVLALLLWRDSPPSTPAVEARATVEAGAAAPPAELAGTLTQVTRNAPALSVVAAAISPDGKWFAYDERDSLRLRNVASGENRVLRAPAGVLVTYLAWTAASDALLVSGLNLETRRSELWQVSLAGAAPTRLVDDATMASVSPTGNRIAFNRGESELWTMAADGSSAELFLQAPLDSLLIFRPGFSRDGKRLYLVLLWRRTQTMQLAVYDIASRRQLFIADCGLLQDFVLLDDATVLASAVSTRGVVRGTHLAMLALDFDRQRVTETHRVADLPYYRTYELSATADGRTASFIRDQTQSDIYLGDLDASGDSLSNVRRLTLDDGADRLTAWLPDNQTVLFHSNREGDGVGIYRQRIDAPRAERLADDGRQSMLPVSTPDGRWLLYMSFAAGGFPSPDHPQSLMRVSLQEPAKPTALSSSGDALAAVNCARRAPRCIYIEAREGRTTFFELDVDSGGLKALFTLPMRLQGAFNWSVSPDGKSVVYVERPSAGMRLAVRDLDSLGSMRNSVPVEGSGALRSVTWDAAGTGVYIHQCVGEVGMLLHHDLKSDSRVLRKFYSSCQGWAIPSPDGRRLAFIEYTSSGNLWTLQR